MIESVLYIIVGFVMLMIGAEYAVRGAVAIAERLRIPSLIIGLTIVALGTSVPEFVVSIKSALTGNAGISVGNVIGSNIANVLLVLGASALIHPVRVNLKSFYRDFAFLFLATMMFAFFILNGKIVGWNGIALLALIIPFILYNYREIKNGTGQEEEIPSQLVNSRWWIILLALGGGLSAIAYGSVFLFGGAGDLASVFGVSEEIIGVTIIAVGTSMPEMATSCVAAFRHQNGIALGNVVGSNIWNIIFVMGATAAITDINVSKQFMVFDVWVMTVTSLMLLPMLLFKNKITRLEGAFMVTGFVFYILAQLMIVQGRLAFI